jgi:hypothetical protein
MSVQFEIECQYNSSARRGSETALMRNSKAPFGISSIPVTHIRDRNTVAPCRGWISYQGLKFVDAGKPDETRDRSARIASLATAAASKCASPTPTAAVRAIMS